MPLTALEIMLDPLCCAPMPAGASAKENAAKDMLHLVLAQRNARKGQVLARVATMANVAARESAAELQRRLSAELQELQHQHQLDTMRVDFFRRALASVGRLTASGTMYDQLMELIALQSLHERIIDGLVAARPDLNEEVERLADALQPPRAPKEGDDQDEEEAEDEEEVEEEG